MKACKNWEIRAMATCIDVEKRLNTYHKKLVKDSEEARIFINKILSGEH